MENELTLRDKFALSMDKGEIPKLRDIEEIKYIADKFGLEWSEEPVKKNEFSFMYIATIRYQYADALIEIRNKKITKSCLKERIERGLRLTKEESERQKAISKLSDYEIKLLGISK